MRLNKFIALSSGVSRRTADTLIANGKVQVNGRQAKLGMQVETTDKVVLAGKQLDPPETLQTIMLNKPVGYVCSRNGQGSKTIYDLLPKELYKLKPVGRLDKNSSGLILLTNDGTLAYGLTHPSKQKQKIYQAKLDKPLIPEHRQQITGPGIKLEDGISVFKLDWLEKDDSTKWQITMHEGRNRQIRRTFEALGYSVIKLHRTQFGIYRLNGLVSGGFSVIAHQD